MLFSFSAEKRTRASAKRQCLKVEKYDGDHLTSLSQPEASLVSPRKNAVISPPAATKSASPGGAGLARSSTIKDILIPLAPVDVSMFSFSQPADMENLLISTQSQPSQQSQQVCFDRFFMESGGTSGSVGAQSDELFFKYISPPDTPRLVPICAFYFRIHCRNWSNA